MADNSSDSENDQRPHIELFVKCSPIDKEQMGPCPNSHKWFMVFFTMVKQNLIHFRVTAVNLEHLPERYVNLNVGKKFPVATVLSGNDPSNGQNLAGEIYETDEEIEDLMVKLQCPGMETAFSAFKVTEDLYRNFNTFLVSNNRDMLIKALQALDNFLGQRNVPFLSGYELTYVDCHVMPRLQHIRVTCEAYKDWKIPSELQYLWKYYETMYDTEAFTTGCPTDRDIMLHYFDKVNPRPSQKTPPTLIADFRTVTI